MADFLTNDSYNVFPSQASSHTCSKYFYSVAGAKGTQEGTNFRDNKGKFTADMVGGLLQYAVSDQTNSPILSAVITEVTDSKNLVVNISQDVSSSEYIIWYGGVQYNQEGLLSAKGLFVNGTSITGNGINSAKIITLGNTASETYVPGPNAIAMYIRGVGGGGSGGGITSPSATGNGGGGGGSGGYFEYFGPAEEFTYSCGTGGAAASTTAGNAGGNTVISAGTFIPAITAFGGAGGGLGGANKVPTGGLGGTVTGALTSLHGESGGVGLSGADFGSSGKGGSSGFGSGGAAVAVGSGVQNLENGKLGLGLGSGGSGSAAFNPTGGQISGGLSGVGIQGVIILVEYSSL